MDYIRRDILIRNIENDTRTILFGKEDALKYVRNALAEDVAPVRHGRWIMYIPPMYTGDALPRCSECRMTSDVKTPFCAQCGASMDGGDIDEQL